MKLPSLNAMRTFEVAARLGTFKGAADELNLTPSAVSRHIRSLEQALGIELFERGFRQVELTRRATLYARRLSEAFRIIENATEDAGGRASRRPGRPRRVTLSINATFMNLWLADRLARFRNLHAEIDLDVSIHDDSGHGGNPSADLRIVFADGSGEPSLVPLVSLVMFPVCAPALVKGPNALRKPADLARHRLLHENTTVWWEEWVTQVGVSGIDIKAGPIFHDPSLAIREAVNGGGVALADNIMAEDLLTRGLLVCPFAIRHPIPESYCLQHGRANGGTTKDIRIFREWLISEVAQHKQVMQLS